MYKLLLLFILFAICSQIIKADDIQEWDFWPRIKWEKGAIFYDPDGNVMNQGDDYPKPRDIRCFDDGECIAICMYHHVGNLVVYKSYDSGRTWHAIYYVDYEKVRELPAEERPPFTGINVNDNGVQIVSKDLAIVNFYPRGTIGRFNLKTFEKDTTSLLYTDWIDFSYTNDNGYGIAQTRGRKVITDDFWVTFKEIDIQYIAHAFVKENNEFCYITGVHNIDTLFFKRSNDGENWERSFVSDITQPHGLYFINNEVGFISGGSKEAISGGHELENVIHRTSDGGKTWDLVLRERPRKSWGTWHIKFYNDNIGIATTRYTWFYKTINGGKTWKLDSIAQNNNNLIIGKPFILNKYILNYLMGYEQYWFYDVAYLGVLNDIEEIKLNKILVYPNPFIDRINIRGDEIQKGNYELKVSDMNGKNIYREYINYDGDYELSLNLSKGVYILSLENSNQHYTRKIIKE